MHACINNLKQENVACYRLILFISVPFFLVTLTFKLVFYAAELMKMDFCCCQASYRTFDILTENFIRFSTRFAQIIKVMMNGTVEQVFCISHLTK